MSAIFIAIPSSIGTATATATATAMDTPLPYSLYVGGNGCTEDTFAGTGVTTNFMAIENEPGSFCVIEEYSDDNNYTDVSTSVSTLYTKLTVNSCDYNLEPGLVWLVGYNCIDVDCGNCTDEVEWSGFVDFSMDNSNNMKDNDNNSEESSSSYNVPTQDTCFAIHTGSTVQKDLSNEVLSSMTTEFQSAVAVADEAEAENSTSSTSTTMMYQKYDQDPNLTQTMQQFWTIIAENSCINNNTDKNNDGSSSSSSSSTTSSDTPIDGNGNNTGNDTDNTIDEDQIPPESGSCFTTLSTTVVVVVVVTSWTWTLLFL